MMPTSAARAAIISTMPTGAFEAGPAVGTQTVGLLWRKWGESVMHLVGAVRLTFVQEPRVKKARAK